MKPRKKETSYENKGGKEETVRHKYSKGKKSTTYTPMGSETQKVKEKRKGFGKYKKKSKVISSKKADRQMARKDKKY